MPVQPLLAWPFPLYGGRTLTLRPSCLRISIISFNQEWVDLQSQEHNSRGRNIQVWLFRETTAYLC